jgi:hypothetical protein
MVVIPPETSPTRYLSALAALNLPTGDGTGDWHQTETFKRGAPCEPLGFLIGPGLAWDTTPYMASVGVVECSALLAAYGIPHPAGPVWTADHARAIADVVVGEALTGRLIMCVDLEGWMPCPEDKDAVVRLLVMAMGRLPESAKGIVTAWIAKNVLVGER